MDKLTKNEYKLLHRLISFNQQEVKKFMLAYLRKHYSKVVERDGFILAEGISPICVIAHLDTVFDYQFTSKNLYYDKEQGVLWCPTGAGFDDRAGIFSIIKLIQRGHLPHLILCCDEEVGGRGASAVVKSYPHNLPFKECKYFVELDRAGFNDMVFYDCENSEFTKYIEQFGFVERMGSFTDISILCPHFKIAGVNLSIGYEYEHSTNEMLFLTPLFDTIYAVENMILSSSKEEVPKFEYIPGGWTKYVGERFGVSLPITGYKCEKCGEEEFFEDEMFPVLALDGTTKLFCPNCVAEHVAWCKICHGAYEKISPEEGYSGVCDLCKEEKNNG